MRVALDATPLVLTSGGLTRYTAELSRALATAFPEDDFVLLSDQRFRVPLPARGNLHAGGSPRNRLERKWWLWGVQREMMRQGCELFHGTDFAVPYAPLRPSVVTVHDLSPWMDPGWHEGAERVRRRTPALLGLRIATMTITPTEAVRAQVIDRFRLPASRVVAVPHGASEAFRPVEAQAGSPYFLYAGTLEPRKNLDTILNAWREVRRGHPVDLVLAGRRRADFHELPPQPGLRLAGEVTDEELARLYSGALAFLYPSHYEGFGLPVLEAMHCGACVFISKDVALREIAGCAALSLGSVKEWAGAMSMAANDSAWIAGWRAKGLARAKDFSWEKAARLTRQVYLEARQRFDF